MVNNTENRCGPKHMIHDGKNCDGYTKTHTVAESVLLYSYVWMFIEIVLNLF